MNSRFFGKTLTEIMGAREPRALYVTDNSPCYLDDGTRVWRVAGLEIEDGNLCDHSDFEILFYSSVELMFVGDEETTFWGSTFTSVSNRAWYDEVEALADEIIESNNNNRWKLNRFKYER